MKVWIVNPFDNLPLEGNRPQRYWLLARAFARAGHDVTLWTSDFSHARKAKRVFCVESSMLSVERFKEKGRYWRLKAMGYPPYGLSKINGPDSPDLISPQPAAAPLAPEPSTFNFQPSTFNLQLIPTPGYRRNIGLARIWSHRAFAKRWRAAAEQETPPDVLIASLPPLALGGEALAFCRGRIKLVVDVQDAWPETFERVVPRWMLAPLRWTAKKIYCGADAIAGVAERYVALARSYGAHAPMKIFRLCIDRSPMGTTSRNQPIEQVRQSDRSLHLVYAGNMGASYDLATVIEGVKRTEGVTLDLAGSGPDEAALRTLAGACDRIRFHGYLGEVALRGLLSSSDVAVIPMFDAACVGVPGKLADYVTAGLPVLNTLHGETEGLLDQYGAGFTYSAGDVTAFVSVVEKCRACRAGEGGEDLSWSRLQNGARMLSGEFDAGKIYGDYVAWVENLPTKVD